MSELLSTRIRRLFRLPRSRRSIQAEVDDEIRFHLESRVDTLRERGIPPELAREMAEREYGDVAASRAELAAMERRRHTRGQAREIIASIGQDVRYAARGLIHRPALAIAMTATLTLGISANAVVFSVVDELLLRPPTHVAHAQALRQVYVLERNGDDDDRAGTPSYSEVTSYAVVRALRQRVTSFADVVATYRRSFVLGKGATAQTVDVSLVDGTFFTALGVMPAAGRLIGPNDSRVPAGEPVAVISSRFRNRHFGDSTNPIGETLSIEGVDLAVIGVAPTGFSGVDREANTDVWVPLGALAAARLGQDWYVSPSVSRFHAIVRLRDGASVDLATTQTTAALRDLARASGDRELDTLATAVLGSINNITPPDGMSAQARTSLWLMGMSAIVLLVAAANVASLLVARAVQRRREIAVRLALGVSRRRLVRQLLTEALLPVLIAGSTAIVVAAWAVRLVERLLLPGFAWSESWIDVRVLVFTLLVMLIACVLAGLAPALFALRTDVNHALKAGSRLWTGSRSLVRDGLLIAQAALSVVLLVGAGLFVRSLDRVRRVDVGIDLDRVSIVTMDLVRAGFDSARQRLVVDAAVERLRQTPGVVAATAIAASTPTRVGLSIATTLPGRTELGAPKNGGPYYSAIDDGFLPTLGTRVVRGRPFSPAELHGPSRVALVNRTTADFYWPGADPIGKCLLLGSDATCTEIVGVVQRVMQFRVINEPSYAQVLIPATHPSAGNTPRTVFVRTAGDPRLATSAIRATIQNLASDMPYVAVRSVADLVAPQLQPWRLGAAMFTVFGLVALVIAAVGLYSVMGYWVSQRTYEFGVRMALGAQRRDVQRAVWREASRTIGVGLALGVLFSAIAAPRIANLLYRTSAHDVGAYAIALAALGMAAVTATIIPTRRSTRVNLVSALRSD
jgi:putative ABC transport system permease protein